jgi:thioredoxin reductase (NADPH)
MAALEADKFLAEHLPDPVTPSIEQREELMIGA